MSDRATLLANCLNEPADDTAREVYADWLREQDDASTKALGRFIWAGVTLSRFRGNEPVADGMFFDAQVDLNDTAPHVISRQIKALLGWPWEQTAWDQGTEFVDRLSVGALQPHRKLPPGGVENRAALIAELPIVTYERGMLTALRLPLARFREVAAAVLSACPLERVEVLDVPGLALKVEGSVTGWRLAGELKLPKRWSPVRDYGDYGPARAIEEIPGVNPFRVCPTASACPHGLTRPNLIANVIYLTDQIVAELRDEAGGRWPGPAVLPHEEYEDAK